MTYAVLIQHVPRTGGVSLHKMICRICRTDKTVGMRTFTKLDGVRSAKTDTATVFAVIGHRHLPSMIRDGLISEDSLKGCIASVITRNPWDRLASMYRYLSGMPNRIHDLTRTEMKTFESFAHRACSTRMNLDTNHCPKARAAIWKGNEFGLRQCQSQCEWHDSARLPDLGQTVMLGRYEELESGIGKLLEAAGIHTDVKLPRRNHTERVAYQDYYSPELRDAVGDRYADDVDRFGYSFEEKDDGREAVA